MVGEKTNDSLGKVRVYLNQGTNAAPIYNGYFYVQANGSDLSVPGYCCEGAFPRMFDLEGDGKQA